jgi:hypothetical protein
VSQVFLVLLYQFQVVLNLIHNMADAGNLLAPCPWPAEDFDLGEPVFRTEKKSKRTVKEETTFEL